MYIKSIGNHFEDMILDTPILRDCIDGRCLPLNKVVYLVLERERERDLSEVDKEVGGCAPCLLIEKYGERQGHEWDSHPFT